MPTLGKGAYKHRFVDTARGINHNSIIGKPVHAIGTQIEHMKFEPLYLQVKEMLRNDFLLSNRSDSSPRLPSLTELQSQYEVSRPTISKALAALAAEGVIVKEAGRGSFAVANITTAAGPSSSSSDRLTIGYVAPLSEAELPQRAFRGIDRIAHRRNCRVMMAGSRHNFDNERRAMHEMVEAGVSGIVLYPSHRGEHERQTEYLRSEEFGVPIVLIDTCTPEQGHSQVTFDNKRACHQMTRWLIEHGHRQIAVCFYPGGAYHTVLAARLRGYKEALEICRIPVDESLINLEDDFETVLDLLLSRESPPTAIMAAEDTTAIEIVEALAHRGLHVPGDITVVGFDNMMVARRYQPAIPTTNPDFELMGEVACEMLLDGIANGLITPQNYVLPVPLLIRPHLNRHSPRPHVSYVDQSATIVPGTA